MPKSKHAHKVKRVNLSLKGAYYVYKCFRPGCTTYYPVATIVGTRCSCWACGKDFDFAVRNLEQVKAKCRKCTGKKDDPVSEQIETASDNILKQLRDTKI